MNMRLCLLLAFTFAGCRAGALTPASDGLAAHLESARAPVALAPEKPAGDDLEARTRAIMLAWDGRLAQPAGLVTIRDFDAPAYAAARTAARAPTFASSLATGLTEPQLLAAAFERNPRIRAAHGMLRATINQYAQVTYLDAILSQYASFQRSSHTRVGMPLAGERMDQRFPFPGATELKAALVRHAVEEARARYAGTVRDVVVDVRVLFARYVFVGRAASISEALLRYIEQLERTARSKLSAGTASKGAVIQVQVEIADLRNRLLTLEQDRDVLRADLRRLMDVPPDTALGEPGAPDVPAVAVDLPALQQAALTDQPDVQALEARLRRMVTMIQLAERTAFPPLSPGLSTMEDPSHATGGTEKQREPFSTRPKIEPDPFFGTKEAYLREARESARAARSRVDAARNRAQYAVARAAAELDTARRLHALYRDVQLAQAEQAYRDAAGGYAADRVEFLNVIDSLRRWLRFRLEAARAVRDVHTSHAHLEGAVGRGLETLAK